MTVTKLLDLDNDGLNLAVADPFLYLRCRRAMYKYHLADMSLAAHNVIFKKDGKSRGFAVCDEALLLYDFCDLYILDTSDLQIRHALRIGADASSDLGGVRYDARKAYLGIRNGKIEVLDVDTLRHQRHDLGDASFWDYIVAGDFLYAGSVRGELIEIAKADMRVTRKTELGTKNICSVTRSGDFLYTVSQDKTIKAIEIDSFETICTAKRAVGGMARILGMTKDNLVVADSHQISLWDARTLQFRGKFPFPTGSYNKGVILHGSRLLGSDYQGLYGIDATNLPCP